MYTTQHCRHSTIKYGLKHNQQAKYKAGNDSKEWVAQTTYKTLQNIINIIMPQTLLIQLTTYILAVAYIQCYKFVKTVMLPNSPIV